MGYRGNRTNHLADIQAALSDWAKLADISERYEEAGLEGESLLDSIRLQIAHRVFGHGTAYDIYECMRSATKYGAACNCSHPNLEGARVETYCGECYGSIPAPAPAPTSASTSTSADDGPSTG